MTQQINNRLIAFTGPDGIGKTTQGKMLVDWMNSESIAWMDWFNVAYVKELNDENHIFSLFRSLVYSLYKQVDVVTLANLIQLNRYVLQKDLVGELKANINKVIVVDRWNVCTYCYVKASGVDQVLAASYLTDEHTVIPGLTIMLVGLNGATRTSNRAANNNMFEDVGDDFNVKLAKTFLSFNNSIYPGKVVKINNDELTKKQTHELIKQVVLDHFRGNL
jgi:thymidylate kinase